MPRKPAAGAKAGEVYLEFVAQGAYVKVTAIDAATGTEVSIVGAANAPQEALQRTALAKLRFVLGKSQTRT